MATAPRRARSGSLPKICSVPDSEPDYIATRYFCVGFLSGSGQYHGATHPVGGARPPLFCVPDRLAKACRRSRGFVSWARSHPEFAQEGAADGLVRFAAQSYPCPPRSAGTCNEEALTMPWSRSERSA